MPFISSVLDVYKEVDVHTLELMLAFWECGTVSWRVKHSAFSGWKMKNITHPVVASTAETSTEKDSLIYLFDLAMKKTGYF